jgi:PAB-dependent poly(A)-specific ribonuclease subunit 2
MSFTSKGTSEILVAGRQNIMFVIDVNKGEIVKQVRLVPRETRAP